MRLSPCLTTCLRSTSYWRPSCFEQVADQGGTVAEDVQVDVGAFADVAGHHAADEPRPERAQQPHQPQRRQAHVAQVHGAAVAFVDAGEHLDLVADFGVGGEVFRFDPLAAEPFGGLAFGGEVFGFDAFVHQAGGLKGDRLTQFTLAHPFKRRYQAHRSGAGPAREGLAEDIVSDAAAAFQVAQSPKAGRNSLPTALANRPGRKSPQRRRPHAR